MSKLATFGFGLLGCSLIASPVLAFSPAECRMSKIEINRCLKSADNSERIEAFGQILLCRDEESIKAVETALDDSNRMVVAAAAMTLAMSGKPAYQTLLLERYLGCPSGAKCTTDPAYLRAAVIVACGELKVGQDPVIYDLPEPPIEPVNESCVHEVQRVLEGSGGYDVTRSDLDSSSPDFGEDSQRLILMNFIALSSRSGSKAWFALLEPSLSSPDDQVRKLSAIALTHFDRQVSRPLFLHLLEDTNPTIRRVAVDYLAVEDCAKTEDALRMRTEIETDPEVQGALRHALQIVSKIVGCSG